MHLLSSVGGIGSGSEFILMDLPRTLEEVFLINLLKLGKKKKKKIMAVPLCSSVSLFIKMVESIL